MRLPALLLTCLLMTGRCFAQQIAYTVRFPNAIHHEARISLQVTGAPAGPLTFRMSRSSPGRYATHEFGKNVYDVTASDGSGSSLPLSRLEGDVYQVTGTGGTVQLGYTLFGNYADGTYAAIDAESIHLNIPATFMWVKGLENAPITLTFDLPDTTLTIATQLIPTADRFRYTAPGLQYFMDSPVKIGRLQWRTWTVSRDGKDLKFRLAVEADTGAAGIDWLAQQVKGLTEQAAAVFGEYPAYDHGTYTFIASLNPYVHGDGMEHRNSTMITQSYFPGPKNLSVFAHEYFHSWNVERLRPRSLEPFNFERSNLSEALWFAEGFTTYYGSLLTVRVGLETPAGYTPALARLVNAKQNTPGGRYYTPVHASQTAVFADAGVSVDQTNYANMFTSYYPYGAAIGLALDLTLRGRYGTSLDRLMQTLWQSHGRREHPYALPDLQEALAKVSDAALARDFFSRYIYGTEQPDYGALLAPAGFALEKADPGKAWIGPMSFSAVGDGLQLDDNSVRNTPLYDAGLDAADIITGLDGRKVGDEVSLQKILAARKPGERLTIAYKHRGRSRQSVITLSESPELKVVLYEAAGKPVTEAVRSFRNDWLGPK